MDDKSLNILMIEDNPGDSRLIREMLSEDAAAHYHFKCVDRLSKGLEILAGEKCDVILLDLGLPDSQGLDTLKRVRSQFPEKPVVVLTGHSSRELAIEAVREGAQDYLVKGMVDSSEALWRIIQYAIGRSQSEQRLRDSEARLKEAQALGKIGSWEYDVITNKIEWSDQVYELFHRDKASGPPSEQDEAGYYSPEEAARLREFSRLAIEKGEQFNYDLKAMLPGGKVVFFNAWMRPVKNTAGQVIKLIGTVQDITQRKQAEDAVRLAEENFRNSLDYSPLGIRIVDTEGETIYANRAIIDLFGFGSFEELKTARRVNYYTAESYAEFLIRKEKRQRGEYVSPKYEISIVTRTGELRHLLVLRQEVQWNGTQVFQVIYQNVTDSKRLEEEQQRVAKMESIGILAGGIAHDFNNILTAILGNINIAKMKAKPGSELYNDLEKAEKASLRATGLTQQLLTFSKGGRPVRKLASLSELLKDTASFAMRGSNVQCEFFISADLWHAEVDEGQIGQVINNLVINACQAMPSGGTLTLRAENMILSEQHSVGRRLPLNNGEYIRIVVADQGAGMPEEYLDKIFDPFFTTKQTGSGLGLATSFSIVHNHGGYISVESKLGSGSTFYIYLPASTETATPTKVEVKEPMIVGSGRILVMDDEDAIRDVAGGMLRHIGFSDVTLTVNGQQAISEYQEAMKAGKPFAAVILDLTIPGGMGGKETIQKLLEIDPGVKAIVSSGYSGEDITAEYQKYGFKGIVSKPYTMEQLSDVLGKVIGGDSTVRHSETRS